MTLLSSLLGRWGRRDSTRPAMCGSDSQRAAGAQTGSAAAKLAAARQLIDRNEADAALPLLHEVVKTAPTAEVLDTLGVALTRLARYEEALASFQRATDVQPDYVPALLNQAGAQIELGRLEDAEDSCNLALAHDNTSNAVRWHLATIRWRQGNAAEAMALCRAVIERDTTHAGAHIALGTLLFEAGCYEEALGSLVAAEALLPPSEDLCVNQGIILQRLGRHDEAIARHRRALEMNSAYPEAAFNLANALQEKCLYDEAIENYERAIALRPRYSEAWNNLGNAWRAQQHFDRAEKCYRSGLAVAGDDIGLRNNLVFVLSHQARYDEACRELEAGLQTAPDDARARMNLGMLRLLLADFERGWAEYESRFTQQETLIVRRDFPYPTWRGEALAGKSILIWGEQGVGDEISMSSLYGQVSGLAERCLIECAPKLVPLFARSFPRARVVPKSDPPHPATLEGFDFQSAACSLGRWVRMRPEDFPPVQDHLVPSAERVTYWEGRIGRLGAGLKVGIGWRSGNLKGERAFYCTRLDQWGPILAVPGVHFVNLQYDDCTHELQAAASEFGATIHNFSEVDLFDDIDDTAALTQALDLVIAAPTSTSVIAAAVGIESWQMSYGPDWQMHGTDRNPWHPTMKLYRRAWNVPWEDVIDRIAHDLAALAAQSTHNEQAVR